MSGVFSYNDEQTKKQEQDRLNKLEERRRKELDSRNISGAAGMSSVLKNVELARYHEDSGNVKQAYKSILSNPSLSKNDNDFLTHREQPRSTLLTDIKKPDFTNKLDINNDYKPLGLDGSRTDR